MKSRKLPGTTEQSSKRQSAAKKDTRRGKKLSEYGKQLEEKQKVKRMYGVLEKRVC